MNKAQHPTSGIAKYCTSHQIPHHAMWTGGIEMWCDTEWCAVPEMRFDVKYCWAVVVRCGMCNTSLHLALHHIIPPHFTHSTTFYIASCSTSNTDHLWRWFQTIPHSTSPHHSSPYHTFHIIPAPLVAARYSTLRCHIKKLHHWYRPHYASCHISCCIPFYIAFHVTDTTLACTPHHISDHTLYWPHASLHILDNMLHCIPHLA